MLSSADTLFDLCVQIQRSAEQLQRKATDLEGRVRSLEGELETQTAQLSQQLFNAQQEADKVCIGDYRQMHYLSVAYV